MYKIKYKYKNKKRVYKTQDKKHFKTFINLLIKKL